MTKGTDTRAPPSALQYSFEALRYISTLTPPVYSDRPDATSNSPPSYCHCSAHGGDSTESVEEDADLFSSSDMTAPDPPAEDPTRCRFTNRELQQRLASAETELLKWKSSTCTLRRQGSEASLCSITSQQGIANQRQRKQPIESFDLKDDFREWIQMPSLQHLSTNHRLERRHWPLERSEGFDSMIACV
jgi:hypothetical protein